MVKKVVGLLLGVVIVLGLGVGVLGGAALLFDLRVTVVSSLSFSPEILRGTLVVAAPQPVGDVGAGAVVVAGVGEEPYVGKMVGYEVERGGSVVYVQGSSNPADVIGFSSDGVVYEQLFSVPGLGFMVAPFMTVVGAVSLILGVVGLVLVYSFVFFVHPKRVRVEKVVEVQVNQFSVLEQFFREAPKSFPDRVRRRKRFLVQEGKNVQ